MALLSSEAAFEILDDLKRVYNVAGRITKRMYMKYGKFSDRQVKKHFGGFNEAFDKAGLRGSVPSPAMAAAHKSDSKADTNKDVGDESSEFVGDKWNAVRKSEKQITSLAELLEFFKVDQDIWDIERWKCNTWAMAGFPKTIGSSKNWSRDTTEPIVTPIYQVSATFIKKKIAVFAKLEFESLKERLTQELSGLYPAPKPIVRAICTASGNMLELNVPDLHAGKLAWSKETGYKDYDTNIALDTFDEAVDTLLARSAHIHFDEILFVLGNDIMHSDTIAGTTTSGTQLDNDSRYHKTFVKLRNRVIDIIKYKLLPVANVRIVGCPGNHDKLSAWHLADSLDMYFHDNPNVRVDNSPEEFKFVQWGQVMLMFAHGNTGKKPDYPLTMATKQKEMWAATTFREAHTGHIHQTMVQEFHGVRVRVLPALCEPDAWHAANNFVGNLKTAEAYAWNNEQGLINKAFYNAP